MAEVCFWEGGATYEVFACPIAGQTYFNIGAMVLWG